VVVPLREARAVAEKNPEGDRGTGNAGLGRANGKNALTSSSSSKYPASRSWRIAVA
jgi:hypothetical protein